MLLLTNSFNKLIGLILLMAVVASCSNKVEEAKDGAVATFFVENIDGSSLVSKVDSTYSIPTERLYNFKACVRDIMQSKAIMGQSFIIIGGESNKTVNTDEQGCLNWSESIDFNFIAQSNYVELKRTIKANGIHKGSTEIKLVVNPWSRGSETSGVIDPTKNDVNAVIKNNDHQSAFMANNSRSPLWAISPKVSILEKEINGTGASMVLKLQTKLSLMLKDTALQKIQYPISNGTFNIEMILYNSINENGNETIIPIASSEQANIGFTQDILIAEFPFNLNTLPNKGQIFMALKITAPNNELGIDPFEGVFMLSDSANIKLETSPSLSQTNTFAAIKNKVEEKTEKIVSNKENVKPGIEVDKLEIRFFKIGSESTTDRQVFFNVKACMKSNLDGRKIRDESFMVKTVSGKNSVAIKSTEDGCVSWDDSVWHKVFASERFIKSSVNISNKNYNLNVTIPVMINPWDSTSNFGRDGRFVDDLGSVAVNPSSENTKIVIDNYGFSVTNYNYEINKNLDLSLIKNGVLTLSAKVVNHSSLSYGRMGRDSLRDGKYLLKWAVVTIDENQKLDTVLSNGQKMVDVFGGDIKTNIGFKVSAFDKLNVRSRLVVALYTVKESKLKNGVIEIDRNSGLEATPHMATIILNNDQDSQKMLIVDNNLGLAKGDLLEKIAANYIPASLADYTSKVLMQQNLKRINLANENESLFLRDGLANPLKYYTQKFNSAYYHEADQKPAIATSVLVDFAKTGKLSPDLAVKFCNFWINDYFRRQKADSRDGVLLPSVSMGMVQSCVDIARRDPSKFFTVDKKLLVKKVGGFKYVSGTTTNFSVGNTFSASKADASSKVQTFSFTTSAGVSFDFLEMFKVGATGSYVLSSSKTKSETMTNSAQVNASTYLFMQASNFNIDIQQYEECSSIRLNPEMFMGKNARYGAIWNTTLKGVDIAKAATAGFFICTGVNNNTPITKAETFYFVSQDMNGNRGEQDGYAAENHQFFMTFRGQKDLMNFLSLIQSSVQMPGSTSAFNSTSVNTKTNLINRIGTLPTWPGAYSEL